MGTLSGIVDEEEGLTALMVTRSMQQALALDDVRRTCSMVCG
jgi:ABC-type uncharacterized transport system ATPase component